MVLISCPGCDLENAYLNAKCCERIWFEAGIECSEDTGKVCVLTRALYGLKSAGASWQAELARVLQDLGYELSMADLDVWIHKVVTNSGHEYYEMLFVYVNDILSVSHKSQEAIAEITTFFKPKDGSIKELKIFLGGDVAKMQLPNGQSSLDGSIFSSKFLLSHSIRQTQGLDMSKLLITSLHI